jgi:2-deoxy-D-gluconate 3-dehydrogenase
MSKDNPFNLEGKGALVTGGGQGFGRTLCLALAQAGADVAVADILLPPAQETTSEIQAMGRKALTIEADVSRAESVHHMIAACVDGLGKLDILVNNAGASPAKGSVLESDERLWDKLMDINLKGAYFISQAAANVMIKQGGGKIINIASIDGHNPEPGLSIYAISKAGIRMLTRAFASELVRYNIQVNTIAPGPIATKMLKSNWEFLPPEDAQKVKELVEKALPSGRIGDPDEIAGAALYLASNASSYTTGTEIVIDGGVLLGIHAS